MDTIPRGDGLMDRNRKQLTRATVVAAAVITAGLTVVIAANRLARADLDPEAADYAVMDEDLYGALVVAILGFVVCLVALGIHWVVRGRGAQGRDAPSTSPPLWPLLVVGVYYAMIGIEDSPGWYYAFHFGVGALCLIWVFCVLFLVEEASEHESPAGTGDRMVPQDRPTVPWQDKGQVVSLRRSRLEPAAVEVAIVIRTPDGRYVHRRLRCIGSDLASGLGPPYSIPTPRRSPTPVGHPVHEPLRTTPLSLPNRPWRQRWAGPSRAPGPVGGCIVVCGVLLRETRDQGRAEAKHQHPPMPSGRN